jgi:hypothetical protein
MVGWQEMRPELSLEQCENGLIVRVNAPMDVLRIVLTCAGAAVLYFFLRRTRSSDVPVPYLILFLFLLAAVEIFRALRGTRVELRVQDLDFVSTGHAPGGYSPSSVSRDDLLRLEFGEGSGGEDKELPCGLYAEYQSDSAFETSFCLLPHIDREQTEQVIQAIRMRYPEIDKLTITRPPGSGLTILNLH